jgi:hypothetical protein
MLTDSFFHALEVRRSHTLAQRDMPTLEALHATEYQLITPNDKVFTREKYLGAVQAQPFYVGWEVGEMACRITPPMALIRYQARLRFPSGREVTCWPTDSYELRAQRWPWRLRKKQAGHPMPAGLLVPKYKYRMALRRRPLWQRSSAPSATTNSKPITALQRLPCPR